MSNYRIWAFILGACTLINIHTMFTSSEVILKLLAVVLGILTTCLAVNYWKKG